MILLRNIGENSRDIRLHGTLLCKFRNGSSHKRYCKSRFIFPTLTRTAAINTEFNIFPKFRLFWHFRELCVNLKKVKLQRDSSEKEGVSILKVKQPLDTQ